MRRTAGQTTSWSLCSGQLLSARSSAGFLQWPQQCSMSTDSRWTSTAVYNRSSVPHKKAVVNPWHWRQPQMQTLERWIYARLPLRWAFSGRQHLPSVALGVLLSCRCIRRSSPSTLAWSMWTASSPWSCRRNHLAGGTLQRSTRMGAADRGCG